MNKEFNDNAPFCDLPNGLEDKSSYLQKFVKAPLSAHPSKPSSQGKECNHAEVMKMCCGE